MAKELKWYKDFFTNLEKEDLAKIKSIFNDIDLPRKGQILNCSHFLKKDCLIIFPFLIAVYDDNIIFVCQEHREPPSLICLRFNDFLSFLNRI